MDGRVRPWRMLVVALAWGSCFLLLDWGVRGGSVLWFVTRRALIVGLALGCFSLLSRRRTAAAIPRSSVPTWGLIGVLGILNVAVAFAAMAASIGAVTTGAASVLGNAQALLVVLPAWWLFGEQPQALST